jgi:hypothetical protein
MPDWEIMTLAFSVTLPEPRQELYTCDRTCDTIIFRTPGDRDVDLRLL